MQKLKVENPEDIKEQIRQYLKSSNEGRFVHRLHGILLLLSNKENNCTTVASLFNNSPRSLSNWVYKLNESGDIEVLRDKPKSGRPPRLNGEQMEHIKNILQDSPSKVGLTANIWDGKTLSNYIEKKFSIKIGVRQSQRLFHKLGFSLKRARPIPDKGDDEKKLSRKELHEIALSGKYDIYFEDECHF